MSHSNDFSAIKESIPFTVVLLQLTSPFNINLIQAFLKVDILVIILTGIACIQITPFSCTITQIHAHRGFCSTSIRKKESIITLQFYFIIRRKMNINTISRKEYLCISYFIEPWFTIAKNTLCKLEHYIKVLRIKELRILIHLIEFLEIKTTFRVHLNNICVSLWEILDISYLYLNLAERKIHHITLFHYRKDGLLSLV